VSLFPFGVLADAPAPDTLPLPSSPLDLLKSAAAPAPAFSSASATPTQTANLGSPFIIGSDTTAAGDVVRQVVPIAVIGIAAWGLVRVLRRR